MNKLFALFFSLFILVLVGCSGGSSSGAETENNQDTSSEEIPDVVYNGPDPTTDDVQNFKINVWDNLSSGERCGACHFEQAPAFVRTDDINAAYAEANSLVDLDVPSDSRLVTKVASGHNCWESVASVCADIITGYINSWAQASGSVSNTIVLSAPALQDVGETKNFPADVADFETTVYPLVNTFCSGCHSEDAPLQQQPFIGSSDVEVAYEVSKSRMDLITPASSRLVTRLRSEFHNCWTEDCLADADAMQQAITDFSDLVPVTAVDPALVISRAMGLQDGIAANSGGRVETNVIGLWDFSTGTGTTAFDKTGIEPALHLTLSGDVSWVGSYGLNIGPGGRAQGLTQDSTKLYDMITATGEYSIEAWVVPGNVSQEGPARIISYSGSNDTRNFMLGQTLYNYDFQARSSTSDANGSPALSTPDADEVLQATLQHVVATFDPIEGRKLYVNGELIASEDAAGGNLNAWDSSFALVLGAEVGGEYAWEGIVRFLAIYNRAMPVEDILNNFDVGVGQRFFVLFNVEQHVSVPEAYIVFEVSQFDDYAYLFSEPFFISLDDEASVGNIHIEGMYLGVNGSEVEIGQAFANLDVDITDETYESGVGQTLSSLGTVVPLQLGASSDLFFLSFDSIGNSSYDRPALPAPTATVPEDLEPAADIGLKNFAEINATLSIVTGVPVTESSVFATYNTLLQQLPTAENMSGFLSSHQMGVTQLAVSYCNAMVTAAGGSLPGRDQLIDDLLANLLASGITGNGGATLTTQPDPDIASAGVTNSVRQELAGLYDQIESTSGTSAAAIATCAAATGSAITLIQ